MNKSAILLLLLCCAWLSAQTASPDLQNLRVWVAQNPGDASARLDLAYHLMLSGSVDEALKHYETLLIQHPKNEQAMAGVLWALQSSGRNQQSIFKADDFLKQHPDSATLHNYKAYALSQLGDHLAARKHYATARKLAKDDAQRHAATLGLAWEYLFLQDYSAATARLKRLEASSDSTANALLQKAHYSTSLSLSTNYDAALSGSLSLNMQKAVWSAAFKYDELLLKGSHFRHILGASVQWQNPIANLKLGVNSLAGEDKRVYPGFQYSLSLEPVFYLEQVQLCPSLGGHYSSYPRFDVQQADWGLSVKGDRLSGGYHYYVLYQDNDSIDSDRKETLHSFDLGALVHKQMWIRAYLVLGDQAWWSSPYDVINDDFETFSTVYGLSLYSPITKNLGILLYSQFGKQDNETDFSSALTLSYRI